MKKLRILIFPTLAVLITLILADQAGAFSIKELLGLEDEQQEENVPAAAESTPATADTAGDKGAQQNWARPDTEGAQPRLLLTDIQQIIANLDGDQKQTLLADETAFKNFVQQEAGNLSVLTAARANKVDKDAKTLFLMQRGAENILRESYLNKLIAVKIPQDFPTAEQVKEYYDKNKENFVLPERVHVWQIFLPVTEDMDKNAVITVENDADSIVRRLQQNKLDFATAALQYSHHENSKNNGGYMGLIKVEELKPAISGPLMKLADGKISNPIKTEAGFHIVKRGAIVPAQEISFDQVEIQIKNLLIKQARAQLRKAIYEQAANTYPLDIKDSKIEEWRLRLKTNLKSD